MLSGGRLDLGLGVGRSPSSSPRPARTEEYVRVLRTLWTDDPARFDGEFYTVPPASQSPKPVQVGGVARPAPARAGRIAAGWLSRSATDLDELADDIAVVRAAAPDPAAVRVVVRGVVRVGPRTGRLTGTHDEIRADAKWLAEQGVTELYYDLNWDDRIGNPDVPTAAATAVATEIVEALAPGSAR